MILGSKVGLLQAGAPPYARPARPLIAIESKLSLCLLNKFLVWHKKFGPAQNILGPVKGQGIRVYFPNIYTVPSGFANFVFEVQSHM